MTEQRRHFLKLLATGAMGSTLASLPTSIKAALSVAPAINTGTIMDVQHVVILMQENRSFDHYLGALRGVRGFDDPRPIMLPSKKSVWYQPKATGSGHVLPFRLNTQTTSAQCLSDIDHNWKGSHSTWKNYDAWVKVKGALAMGHFVRDDLPFYYALADAFTVCDAYYCSIFGPTNPNRMFLFSGCSGLTVGATGTQAVYNVDDGNWTGDASKDNLSFSAFTWTTYADRLLQAGVSWKVYQEYDNYGDNSLAYFAQFRGLNSGSERYQRARAIVPGSTQANASASRGEHLLNAFAHDVQHGNLPSVSWLVGPYITTEHPSASPAYGESFVSRLLAILAANPDVWSKNVLILNYDENGGFFDHVPAPLPALNSNMGLSTMSTGTESYNGVPVGLGVRTPMFVVSPWSVGGWVNSQVFDHTSVIQFLEKRFGVQEPNISPWRRAVAGDLTSALDFTGADLEWPLLPDTSDSMARADASCGLVTPKPPKTPQMPTQEKGWRPARALPYEITIDGRADLSAGKYWLDFINSGDVGIGLTVYAGNRSDGPWYYTLNESRALSDYWSAQAVTAGIYDLTVQGPNGFVRSFVGDLKTLTSSAANPEVRANYLNSGLQLLLKNSGKTACVFTVKANHYSTAPAQTVTVAAGATVTLVWATDLSFNWYDISITCNSDARFLRRLAGHIENGLPSRSDPAIGK